MKNEPAISPWELACTLLTGTPPEGARWLAVDGPAELQLAAAADWQNPAARQKAAAALRRRGFLRKGATLQWPAPEVVNQCAAQLAAARVRLHFSGAPAYPARLATRLAEYAPRWLWAAGAGQRLRQPGVAIVGSRHTPLPLQQAAHALAAALAAAGIPVVSGMAPGADSAAHAGALSCSPPGAGTVAFPARGILNAGLTQLRRGALTVLGLGRPAGGFTAPLALARNDLIAAQGHALVLVASQLSGGSSYAVDWARRHATPIFCFECGKTTPPANHSLLKTGLAHPLPLAAEPGAWRAAIEACLAERSPSAPPTPTQLSIFE